MRVCIRARPLSLPRDARVDGCGPRLALTATTRLALGGGRVGRGAAKSHCLLLTGTSGAEWGPAARERLKVMEETTDGFRIAEEDLRLRGAGELLGTLQSGIPLFRLADLAVHADLLAAARDDARMIVDRDPELASERGRALRVLLYLFERDEAVRYLRAG